MTDPNTGPFQNSQDNAPVSNGPVSTGEMPSATAPTLTMLRGTRPLIILRPANGGWHDDRRRRA